MYKFVYIIIILIFSVTTLSCSKKESADIDDSSPTDNSSTDNSSSTTTEDISISSSADNSTVVFGQTYQYDPTTSGSYSGTLTYSLSNAPDGMTISSSGLVEWTPNKASEIKTFENIKITVTTASGYVITQTFDLAVTGSCVSGGNIMAIWSGDQRTSTDSSKFLGNITAYTDNSSVTKTPVENYGYTTSGASRYSVNKTFGPTASAGKGSVFFYNEYDNRSYIFLFYYFGEKDGSDENDVNIDVFTTKNNSASYDVVDDDESIPSTISGGETRRVSQDNTTLDNGSVQYSSKYTGRYSYKDNSDGAVIGPLSGSDFRVFVDLGGTSTIDNSTTLTLAGGSDGLTTMKYFSGDGTTHSLGNYDNFTVGFKTSMDCSN